MFLLVFRAGFWAAQPLNPRHQCNGVCRRGQAVLQRAAGKHEQLQERARREASLLAPRLGRLRELHTAGILSAADVCVAYILAYLQVRHGKRRFAGRRAESPALSPEVDVLARPQQASAQLEDDRLRDIFDPPSARELNKLGLEHQASLRDLIQRARLIRMPEHVATCLSNFYLGLRPLTLCWRIPSPEELLEMQAAGSRCVSALTSEHALQVVYGHRDCLDMLTHDLAHMEKFVEANHYWQQVGFFEFLRVVAATADRKPWSHAFGNRWRLSWNYVSADMNAVANHLLLTFRSQLEVAIARLTLTDAGLLTPRNKDEDAALANEHADVCPRAAVADWEPALRDAGLMGRFHASFASEWHRLMNRYLEAVEVRFPGITSRQGFQKLSDYSEVASSDLGSDFSTWPRPTAQALLQATEVGEHCDKSLGGHRAQSSVAVIAHFDELGRRCMRGDGAVP
mmetsp:Transcript_22287/g.42601  ORF Transcript_22287/g.42601 Transcript_22287/m.42601 type:complete len:456 (-) Transcript_22287:16-1383(-)